MKKNTVMLVVLIMVGMVPVARATSFSDKVLALNPVAYWQFEGNYNDSSGHGNTLIPYGSAGITSEGPSGLGSAADLTSASGPDGYYVATPSGSSLNFGGTRYSINLWYCNALSANETTSSSILVNKRNSNQWLVDLWDYGMWLADYGAAGDAIRGTVGAAYDFDSAPLSSPPISPAIPLDEKNVWHMATVTWSKDTGPAWSPDGAVCFYLDGKLVGAGPGIGDGLQQAAYRLILGNRASPGDDYQGGGFYVGKLDEVAIFSTALTPEEVADLYGTPIPPPQGLSRGHQILIQRGLQIQAAGHTQAWGYFNVARWVESHFTTYNSDGYALDPTLMPEPPGIPWSRVCADGSFDINSAEVPYTSSLVDYQLKDESDLTDSAELEYQSAAAGWFRVKYPNAMTFTSQYGPRYTPAQWQTYMQQAKPDMLLFSVYPFYGQSDGAAGVNELGANLQKYRLLSLAGNDGTAAQPIPFGLWLQTYWRDSPIDPSGYHAVSESEIRANQFVAWAFGAKFADAYVYDNEGASIRSVLFSGSGQNSPTTQFYQIAETNRQSRNLGSALVGLITTDVRMKLGRTAAGVPSPPVAGVSNWASGADPYIDNITVTNQGTRNNGYEGDVVVGYFKPLDASFTNAGHADDIYFMIVNGLTYPSGLAADTRQLIHLDFDFGTSGITSLLRLNRLTGLVETVNLTYVSGSLYSLDLYLDGGTGDLFKFNNGGTFVSPPVGSSTYLMVSPSDNFTTNGPVGGPFSPSSKVYTLTNISGQSLNWQATCTGGTWITLSSYSGTLAPGDNVSVTANLNSIPNGYGVGSYGLTLNFTNLTDNVTVSRRATLLVTLVTPYSNAVNALNPVGYWQFEGNYNDSTANGNNLTAFGTVGFTPAGLPGLGANALDLRHVGGEQGLYVSMLPGNALNLTGSQYSITAWFSNDEASGTWGMLALNRDATWGAAAGANYGISNYLDTDVTTIGWKAWPTWGFDLSGTSAGAKAWHMMVLSVDLLAATDKYKVYVDGALVATGTHSLTSVQGPGTVFVVGNNETPLGSAEWGAGFNGRIDELAVFGSALSAGDVATLYAAASATTATLTGQVHLEGFGGVPQDVLVRVELRQGATVDVRRITPDAGWGFSLSGITPGTYTITIQTPGWRPVVLADKSISGTTTLDPVTLPAGDLSGDGHIIADDLAVLLENMDK